MGLYLLDILVQGELHGEATLSNNGGAITTIRFPDEGGLAIS
jgi:hypothetical protein